MNLENILQSINITTTQWQILLDMSIIILCSVPILSVTALPILCITGQIISQKKKRSAYNKCAKQLSLLCFYLGTIVFFTSSYLAYLNLKPFIQETINAISTPIPGTDILIINWQTIDYVAILNSSIQLQAYLATILLILGGTLSITLYTFLWKKLQNSLSIHQSFAFLGFFWYACAIYSTSCIVSTELAFSQGELYPTSLTLLLTPSLNNSLWSLLPYLPMLCFIMAGGIGSVWLIMRRKHDDFGRDYYAQMLPWCATWARNAWFILWTMLIVVNLIQWYPILQSENYLNAPEFMHSFLFLILWLIPGLLWAIATRSKSPLRHKFTLILAIILGMGIIIPIYNGMLSM